MELEKLISDIKQIIEKSIEFNYKNSVCSTLINDFVRLKNYHKSEYDEALILFNFYGFEKAIQYCDNLIDDENGIISQLDKKQKAQISFSEKKIQSLLDSKLLLIIINFETK